MNKEELKDTIISTFSNFSSELDEITKHLVKSPDTFNGEVWNVICAVFDLVLPIGYSLVVLFFIIDFLNKSVHLEWMRWENVVKALLKLVVAKLIIENSFTFLNTIFLIVSNIIEKVRNVAGVAEPTDIDISNILTKIDGMDYWERIGFVMTIQPWLLAMQALKIVIYVIVYGRMIEILLMTAIAPLPLSTLAGENTQGIAKRFIQTYVAVCLQGVILLLGTMIYGVMMTDFVIKGDEMEIIRNFVMMSLVLVVVYVKSGNWARQITGVG